jgi:hypothetical protein
VVQRGEKTIGRLLLFFAALIVLYWTLWFVHRSVVASDTTSSYYNFENAFPLADSLLVLALLASFFSLRRGLASALLFLLLGAGGGFYLCAMDVLYDLEHGIWTKGAGGAIEAVINVLTLIASVYLARWAWTHRRELDPPKGEQT